MTIATRLKAARRASGLTQGAICATIRAGEDGHPSWPITQGTISKWETEGHTSYDMALLARVCALIGTTLDRLANNAEPQCAATYAQAHVRGDHDRLCILCKGTGVCLCKKAMDRRLCPLCEGSGGSFERQCPLCKDMIAR